MKEKRIIGLYPLCGDLLHVGHIAAMREAKEYCDYLIVAVNATPEGKNPIQSIYERFMQVHSLRVADEVIIYGGRKDLELIAGTLNYQIRFLGNEYMTKTWDGKEQEEERGIKPHFISTISVISSTELRNRVHDKVEERRKAEENKK